MKTFFAMLIKRIIGFFMKKFTCLLLVFALALATFCPVRAEGPDARPGNFEPTLGDNLAAVGGSPVSFLPQLSAVSDEKTAPQENAAQGEQAGGSLFDPEKLPEVEAVLEPETDVQNQESERLKKQCRSIYLKALWSSGKSSLRGFCGLMTGLQIWRLGLTKGAEIYNGNGFYDAYKRQSITSAGYNVKTIDASAMRLEEALNHVTAGGTRNAYNLIACFQWTNTRAGAIFGHAVVIHGIVDGQVYFVEGFPTSLGGAEGNTIVCSISEFEDFYGDWTSYEGLVELGDKRYTDFCKEYPTDLFVTAPGAMILDEPQEEGLVIRSAQDKEILRVSGIYQNPDGAYYYRVDEGFIEVGRATVQQVNLDGPTAEIALPEITPGQDFSLGCKVVSSTSNISAVQVNIVGADGKIIQTQSFASSGRMRDLPNVQVAALEQGVYRVQVLALVENTVLEKGNLRTQKTMHTIYDAPFGVGQEADVPAVAPTQDGWVMEGGVRYCYKDGAPRVGWYCDGGADYYFAPDGAVTTGWAKINGKWRCFTDTGVMRTGWVDAPWGRCYLLSNGEPAVGEKVIDGVTYTFGDDGAVIEN